ncbi:DgyrCDS5857 [Dimorphilus gyrociliatus]|uniref:DgyrCDS5857 n=1 Tax=Dimorphilus gyrociliatus TaxID=2664684 RepID=A0A7I8VLY9_9ANNE|nr:DgyrCDS5857 [Dimorphilus gyrociliatus]
MDKKSYKVTPTNGKMNGEHKDKKPKEKDDKKKDEPVKEVTVAQVFRFADCKDYFCMIIATIAALIHGAALPCLMLVFGSMVDIFVDSGKFKTLFDEVDFSKYRTTKEDAWKNETALKNIAKAENLTSQYNKFKEADEKLLDEMEKFAIYYVAIGCGVMVFASLQQAGWMTACERQAFRIRNLLLKSILRQDIGWFDTHEVGELNTRLADDVTKIQAGIGDKLGQFLQWFSTFLTGFILGFVFGWKLTLVILSVSPFLVLSGVIMGKLTSSMTQKELSAYAKAGAVAEEVLTAIRTVTAFNGGKKECERYNGNLTDAQNFGVKRGFVSGLSMGMVFFFIFGSYALAFWYGSKLVRESDYTVGDMLIVFFSVVFAAFAIGNAFPNLTHLQTAKGAAYVVYDIIDNIPPIDSSSTEGERPARIVGRVTFENIWFKYPSRPDVPILNGLNLDITPGETVALVGSSGCGKSTTIQLLQRFYDPLQGKVTIDGKDIRELNVEWLRQSIGVVSQEPVLFATTIEENIRYGREGVSLDEIHEAAKSANAYNFIMQLPDQFNTLVGERGAQLSGGQKQRIAIARALVRNPKILLLDEATSALDTESEGIVQEALDEARRGRTTIVVAHRLSTVRTADKIVGFKEGKKIEEGAHDDLMKIQGGVYHHLVTSQSAKEVDDDDDNDELASSVSKVEFENDKNKLGRTFSLSSVKRSDSAAPEEAKKADVPEVALSRVYKLNAPEWVWILCGCFAALVNGAVQPCFAVLFAEILGVFAIKDIDEQKRKTLLYSMLFLAVGAGAALSMFAQAFFFSKSGEALTRKLRDLTFKALMRQEMAYFDDSDHSVGALTTQLASDASAVQGVSGVRLGTMFQTLSSLGTGLVIAFIYSWKLTLGILAFIPFIIMAGALQMKMMGGQAGTNQKSLEDAGKIAVESIENMRTVAQLTKEKAFSKLYHDTLYITHRQNMWKGIIIGASFAFSQSVIFFAYAACFSLGAYLIKNDGLEFADMFRVFGAVVFSAMALGQANSFAPDYGKGKSAANRIFYLLDREPEIDSFSEEGEVLPQVSGDVSFSDVTFRYPSRPDVPVLRGLTLKANKGETLALVGTSGCGKSTTVSLLERFYNPLSGLITLDKHSIDKMNVQWLRSQIGIVQQEPILFDRSIADNIAYGDNSRQVSMDEIIKAAKDANIHDFISNLPDGYETSVGDKGTQLSGGQKQRVAIARAMVKNPKILLLDEATSALDTESERVVQEALDKAQIGRTSIVIAHRLSTIHNADQIAVIHLGKVVELGTHSELMNKQGKYYKLYTRQSAQK